MNCEISRVTSDWKLFKKLRLDAFRNDPEAFSTSITEAENYQDSYWKDMVSDTNNIILSAKIGSDYIGLIRCALVDEDVNPDTAFIGSMYVDKNYRRSGVATKLLSTLLTMLETQEDITKARLWVNEKQVSAVSLYTKMGFEVVGSEVSKTDTAGLEVTELIMEKIIKG